MKKLLTALIIGFIFPLSASANVTAGWSATTSTSTVIFPTTLNGNNPSVTASYFIATTSTSTFKGVVSNCFATSTGQPCITGGTTNPASPSGVIQLNNGGVFGSSTITQDFSTGEITIDNTSQISIGDPASVSMFQDESGGGNIQAFNDCFEFYIYAYNSGKQVYSASPADTGQVCDNGDNNFYKWNTTWSAVPGAAGYKFYVQEDDYNGFNTVDIDVGNVTNYLYDGTGTLENPAIVTPTSPAITYGNALQVNGNVFTTSNINIGNGGQLNPDGSYSIQAGTTPIGLGFLPGVLFGCNGNGISNQNGHVSSIGATGNFFYNCNDYGSGYGLTDFSFLAAYPGGSVLKSIRLEDRPAYQYTTGIGELQFGSTDTYVGGFGNMPNLFLGGQYSTVTTGLGIGQGLGSAGHIPAPPTNGLYVQGQIIDNAVQSATLLGTNSSGQLQSVSPSSLGFNAAWTIGRGKISNATSTDFVSIGTSSTFAKLYVVGTNGSSSPLFTIASTTSTAGATSSLLTVLPNGNVGIGSSTPGYLLSVAGTFRATGTSTLATTTISTETVATSSIAALTATATSTLTGLKLTNLASTFIAVDASGNVISTTTPIVLVITVITPSIGGAIIGLGCDSATSSVPNSVSSSSMAFVTSPQTYPGDGLFWNTYLSAVGVITTKVCSDVTVTPTASSYVVKVIQ